MFQQYQNGVKPVTGMAEAGANIGKMYMQGIGQFGESLAKGIQVYNENSAKSEMANVKIQGLSQDIANKIAIYSQDPEIAQSGVLQGLIQTGQMLTEAPTKGLTQRIGLVHEAETKLAGFGQQLQEWSFLRGRAIERGINEGLKKFENATTTTDPIFFEDPNFAVDPNQTIQQQKDRVMAFFKKVRAANPRIQGSDEDFWAGWVNTAQQKFAKGIEGLNPSVTSAQLEALQAEQNIAKNQKSVNALSEEAIGGMIMNKDGIYEESAPLSSSVKDYAAMTATPADRPYTDVADAMKFLGYEDKLKRDKTNDYSALTSTGDINKHLVAENKNGEMTLNKNWQNLKTSVPVGDTYRYIKSDATQLRTWDEQSYQEAKKADELLEKNVSYYQRKAPNENAFWDLLVKKNQVANAVLASKDKRIESFANGDFGENGIPTEALKLAERLGFQRSDYGVGYRGFGELLPFGTGAVLAPAGYGEATNELPSALKDFFTRVKKGKFDPETGKVDTGRPADAGNAIDAE